MYNLYGWDYPPKDLAENYLKKCKLFAQNDVAFESFRQDEDYIKILEGKDPNVGILYLNKMRDKYGINPSLMNKFKENDIYGKPILSNYEGVNQINHNTIMYAYHTMDMRRFMGLYQPERVIEIGGGYGGMCKVFSSIYRFEEYVLVDLPEPLALCKKYLSHFPELYKKIAFLTPRDIEINNSFGKFDLSIAVFSLSECNAEIQNMYADKIIMRSTYAFIGYNKMHLPGVKEIYDGLIDKFSKKFDISYDYSIPDCLYLYMRSK